jgi:hypothetical protein
LNRIVRRCTGILLAQQMGRNQLRYHKHQKRRVRRLHRQYQLKLWYFRDRRM